MGSTLSSPRPTLPDQYSDFPTLLTNMRESVTKATQKLVDMKTALRMIQTFSRTIQKDDIVLVKVYVSELNRTPQYRFTTRSMGTPNYRILRAVVQNVEENGRIRVQFVVEDGIKDDEGQNLKTLVQEFNGSGKTLISKSQIVAYKSLLETCMDMYYEVQTQARWLGGYAMDLASVAQQPANKTDSSSYEAAKQVYDSELVRTVIEMFAVLENLLQIIPLPSGPYPFDATRARQVTLEDLRPAFENMRTLIEKDASRYDEIQHIFKTSKLTLTDLFVLNFYGHELVRLRGYTNPDPSKYCIESGSGFYVDESAVRKNPKKYGPIGAAMCYKKYEYNHPKPGTEAYIPALESDLQDVLEKVSEYYFDTPIVSLGDIDTRQGGLVMSKDLVLPKLRELQQSIAEKKTKVIQAASSTCYDEAFNVKYPDYRGGFPEYKKLYVRESGAPSLFDGGGNFTSARTDYIQANAKAKASRERNAAANAKSDAMARRWQDDPNPEKYIFGRQHLGSFLITKYLADAAGQLGVMKELIGFLPPEDKTSEEVVSLYNQAVADTNKMIKIAKTKMLYDLRETDFDKFGIRGGEANDVNDAVAQTLIARYSKLRDELRAMMADAKSKYLQEINFKHMENVSQSIDFMVKYSAKFEALRMLYAMMPRSLRVLPAVKQPPQYPHSLFDEIASGVIDSCVDDSFQTLNNETSAERDAFRTGLLAQPNAFTAANDV